MKNVKNCEKNVNFGGFSKIRAGNLQSPYEPRTEVGAQNPVKLVFSSKKKDFFVFSNFFDVWLA